MPLLEVPVGFCKGEPAKPAEQDANLGFAPCERGGPCPRSLDLDSLKAREVRRRTEYAVRAGNRDKLADLLREAASAHHAHEERTGTPDEDWPAWYASYLLGGVL